MANGDITRELAACRAGDDAARARLFEFVYDRLRQISRGQLGGNATRVVLDTTSLVHEAYVKLLGAENADWNDRRHFFAVAARAMRQIVIDHVRSRSAEKRGGGLERVELKESRLAFTGRSVDLLDLDRALERLADIDERLARIVELRFFGGLTEAEVAELLGVTDRTVRRDWVKARALLLSELETPPAPEP